MTKKVILTFPLSLMSNETHLQFNVSIDTHVTKAGSAVHDMVKLPALYKVNIGNETEALDYITASAVTGRLALQDGVRNRLYKGFACVIDGLTDHFDDAMCADAQLIRGVLDHYGYVTRKPADAKTAAIDDIVRELTNAANGPAIERLTMRPWLGKIGEANAGYQALAMERYDEAALRTPHRMRICRPETDRVYHAMENEIENQMLKGDAAPGMTKFIAEWNAIVTHYASIAEREKGRGKGPDAPPADPA
jgi:hypothetical protein